MECDDISDLERDKIWISVFGEPFRDEEMLSWDNLKWCADSKTLKSIAA